MLNDQRLEKTFSTNGRRCLDTQGMFERYPKTAETFHTFFYSGLKQNQKQQQRTTKQHRNPSSIQVSH